MASFAACNRDQASDDDGPLSDASGSGGENDGGSGSGVGGRGDAGSEDSDGGSQGSGGAFSMGGAGNSSGGGLGFAGGGATGEETGGQGSDNDGAGGSSAQSCADDFEFAPTLERWTAYVTNDEFGKTSLWASKSNAPDDAILLHESLDYPITSLRWSPDGRWLAFVHEDYGIWGASLYLVDFGGEEDPEVLLLDDSEGIEVHGSPIWSPDSTRLVYAEPSYTAEFRVVDVSSGEPSAPSRFGYNCPQGAYSDYPCLAAYLQPLRLEWSPSGDHLAAVLISGFFAEFGTGSAADLFILEAGAPEAKAPLASPFVTSFDPARRGVSAATLAWSPGGIRVAYAGSFEDTGSVGEAYAFDASDPEAGPIKLHADLASPHQGVRSPLAWTSDTTVLFAADLVTPSLNQLFSIDVSDPSASDFPSPVSLLGGPGGSVLSFRLSPDRSSLLVLLEASEGNLAALTAFPDSSGPLTDGMEVSSRVVSLGEDFSASSEWSPDSRLLAFLEEEAGTRALSIAGFTAAGATCVTASLQVEGLDASWRWLEEESSLVLADESGVKRLHAGTSQAERLSADVPAGESIVAWAVQPLGGAP